MFENVTMLAGLGGAAAPLVVHLLSRARWRTIEWSGMMFLQGGASSRTHPGRLREATLLVLRMSAVALLAMALARPSAGGAQAPAQRQRTSAAIVVDCSASMAREETGGSRIAQARSAVLRILSTLKRGDQVCLIPAGPEPIATVAFTGDLQSIASRANELTPVGGGTSFNNTLDAAADALATQDAPIRRLYLVCDHQANSWKDVDDDFAADFRTRLARGGDDFVVVPVGSDSNENVAITSLDLANPPAVVGTNALAEVKIRNYGLTSRMGVPLSIRLGSREVSTSTLNLPPQKELTVSAPITIGPASEEILKAEIRADAGDMDDSRLAVVEATDAIRVLVVRGGDADAAGAPDFLVAALAPFSAAHKSGHDLAKVETVSADDWDEDSLTTFQVLVLDDVARLTAADTRAIEQFVYSGGGLLLAPGQASQPAEYNRLLYHEDGGLLPALLQPITTSAAPLRIEPASIDPAHPATRFLARHAGALPAIVNQYFPTTGGIATAHVLASLSSGDPLLIDSSFGRGRVILMTCSLGADGSSLPLTNLYVPLMQSIVRYIAAGPFQPRNVPAGQELIATFPDARPEKASVLRPDGVSDSAHVVELDGRCEVRYDDTRMPGLYLIHLGPRASGQSAQFAVEPPPEEFDPTPLSSARWNELAKSLKFRRLDDPAELARMGEQGNTAIQYWLVMLVGVLGLLVIEMALTRAWSEGRR